MAAFDSHRLSRTRLLSSVVKDANRARQIAAIVARHGFAQLAPRSASRRPRAGG
ncbi:MAG: hypothetical protein MZW92_38225 [Comamonadaceae bacterium]|nr:hypothetical protein [Comamonadaceae bacterium]